MVRLGLGGEGGGGGGGESCHSMVVSGLDSYIRWRLHCMQL